MLSIGHDCSAVVRRSSTFCVTTQFIIFTVMSVVGLSQAKQRYVSWNRRQVLPRVEIRSRRNIKSLLTLL
jgi:hypothetical protein